MLKEHTNNENGKKVVTIRRETEGIERGLSQVLSVFALFSKFLLIFFSQSFVWFWTDMQVSVYLLLVYLEWVWCERCSDSLVDTFKKGFNITDGCDECVILIPGISSEGRNWAGFCSEDKFFLFPDWKCREDNELLNKTDCFVVGANELCELVEENHALNEECLKKFNSEICSEVLDLVDLYQGDMNQRIEEVSSYNQKEAETTETSLRRPTRESTMSTPPTVTTTGTSSTKGINTTQSFTTTSTYSSSSTMSTIFPTTSSGLTTTTPSNTTTTASTRWTPTPSWPTSSVSASTLYPCTTTNTTFGDCEEGEFFFNDHCYFIVSHRYIHSELKCISDVPERERKNFLSKSATKIFHDATKNCRSQHPKALGLAVETEEENDFILEYIKSQGIYFNRTILTSGVGYIPNIISQPDEWRGWNSKINKSILNIEEAKTADGLYYYCIEGGRGYWFLLSHLKFSAVNVLTICERLYNPKNVVLELHKECLIQYRKSSCYNSKKHANFCCEKDNKGELWFACPGTTQKKVYPKTLQCKWTCQKEGFFENDRPSCKGGVTCQKSYGGIEYRTPPDTYAISGCPKNRWGFSTWYCAPGAVFVGTPDYSLCCEGGGLQCRDTDAFLNAWAGCPSKKTSKKVACPPGYPIKEALVDWHCDESGNFSESSPDYSSCNSTTCVQVDRFNRTWKAPTATTQEKNCPLNFVGKCYWKCEKNGKFDGPEPDCSNCKADWMQKIEDKIKSDSNHGEVMAIMENYTKTEDLRIGYGYVLNLTSDCVNLFKKQTCKNEINVFDKFLKSYSRILKNVAANPILWSSFSETNRGEYAKQVLNTTQGAAFAILNSENSSKKKYNVTLAKSETDGFDFFVAYSPSEGSQFPLENSSESDWHLDIKKINDSNLTLAAMGLVMNYNLSSLMFPSGIKKEDLEINAPAVTFTVAQSVNGRVVFDPNVVVSISFNHKSSTRFPRTQIIRRRLHNGEEPSGVFSSTVCCYYKNSHWSTEGCAVTFTSRDRTNCTCNHLSTIGLLMTIHKYVPDTTLEFLSTMSSGITIVSLILALLVFYFFDTVRNERALIGKNLCFCLLIGHFLLLTVLDKKFFNIPDKVCTVYAILLHYTFMAAFAWMFVEGCHLYRMLVLVFDSGIEYRRIYLALGYGVPLVVVGVTAFVGFLFKDQPYGQDEFCWLKPPNYVWAFIGPVIVTTSINFLILVTATKQAISSKQRFESSNSCASKIWLKGWISLSTLLGITWFFGLAYIHYNDKLAYAFVLLNGLQGFFIFLFRCVLCDQYKNIFLKKMKSWFFSSESADHKRSEIVKSETKLCALSASKSLSAEIESKNSGFDSEIDRSCDRKNAKKLEKSSMSIRKTGNNSARGSSEVDIDINITLTPATSETYLKTRTTAKSFFLRKSKQTGLVESDNFPELSYHNIHHLN